MSAALMVGLATLAAVSLAVGCAAGPVPIKHPPNLGVGTRMLDYDHDAELYEFANGLQLLVLPDRNTNLVKVDVRYRVGAAEDPLAKTGLAHLVEHLSYLLRLGGTGPSLHDHLNADALFFNAYTTWDETHYTSVGFSDQLVTLLALEATRMIAQCSAIDIKGFDHEREVVRNEVRGRMGPGLETYRIVRQAVYGPGHAYERTIGGSDKQLAAMQLADACAFMNDHYAPDRAIVVVSGDVSPTETSRLVGKLFGVIAKRGRTPRKPVAPVSLSGTQGRHELAIDDATAHVMFAVMPFAHHEAIPERLLVKLATRRLYSVVEEHDFITDIDVSVTGGVRAPVLVISISVDRPERLNRAVDMVFETLEVSELFDDFDDDHLVALREERRGALLRSAEPFMREATIFADYLQYADHTRFLRHDLDILMQLRLDGLKLRAHRLFQRSHSHVAYVYPNDRALPFEERSGLRLSQADEPHHERNEPPDPAAAERALEVPARIHQASLRSFRLPNGLQVVMAPALDYPVVDIRLMFQTGSLHDPAGKNGLARMAMMLLQRSIPRIRTQVEANSFLAVLKMGGDIHRYMDERTTTFRITGLAMNLDGLLWDLHWLLENGVYRGDSLGTLQNLLSRSKGQREQDSERELKLLLEALYGAGHPYAESSLDARAARRVSIDDLRAFRARHYRMGDATLLITGRFDPAFAEAEVRRLFSWGNPAVSPALPGVPAARRRSGIEHLVVYDDELVQTQILIAFDTQPGFARHRAQRMVLQEMIRDKLSSLRETLGATYGVRVKELSRAGPGMLLISSAVDRMRAGEAYLALRDALAGLRAGEFTAEFIRARRRVLRELLANTLHSEAVADELEFVATYGLPRRYHQDLARQVASMRPAAITRQIARDLAESHQVVMIRGRRDSVIRMFEQAGLSGYRLVK